MMYNTRFFLEHKLPVPYKGISLLFERVLDDGIFGDRYRYDVYIAFESFIECICPARDFPYSAEAALSEYIEWVDAAVDYIKRTDPEGACTLVGKDFFCDDGEEDTFVYTE